MNFRAAWNEGEIEVGTLIDEIERLQAELVKCAAALPGVQYMNPPDGGDVPVSEQLQRMAKDAARYRWLSVRLMGADFNWNGSGALALAFELPKTARIFSGCNRAIDEAIALTHTQCEGCGGINCQVYEPTTEELAEIEADSLAAAEAYSKPPCQECGAMTLEEAQERCICGGDKDDCHGTKLWPD